MSDFQTEMNRVVQGFVGQITELARRAAIDTLEAALGKSSGGSSGGGRSSGGSLSSGGSSGGGGSSPPARASRSEGRGRGAKRTSDELERLSGAFVDFVRENPGMRIEQINKHLGTTTKDLALPIRKLIADGVISAKGQKRSTTYHHGGGGGGGAASGKRGRKAKS